MTEQIFEKLLAGGLSIGTAVGFLILLIRYQRTFLTDSVSEIDRLRKRLDDLVDDLDETRSELDEVRALHRDCEAKGARLDFEVAVLKRQLAEAVEGIPQEPAPGS